MTAGALAILSGDGQTNVVGELLQQELAVRLTVDAFGNLSPAGTQRSMTVGDGGTATVSDGPPGERRWSWTLGAEPGMQMISYTTCQCCRPRAR